MCLLSSWNRKVEGASSISGYKVLFWLNGKWTELLFLRRLYFLTIIYIFYENIFRFNFLSLESYYFKKTEFPPFWSAATDLNKQKTDKRFSQKVNDCFRTQCCVFFVLDYSRCYNRLNKYTVHFLRKCPSFQPRIIWELTDQKPQFQLNWGLYLVLLDQ